jgi:hypothetical protein
MCAEWAGSGRANCSDDDDDRRQLRVNAESGEGERRETIVGWFESSNYERRGAVMLLTVEE